MSQLIVVKALVSGDWVFRITFDTKHQLTGVLVAIQSPVIPPHADLVIIQGFIEFAFSAVLANNMGDILLKL